MGGTSSSRGPAPKISSAAAFSTTGGSISSKSSKSSILLSAFPPPELELSLFASTIASLDSQQLRIHDTISGDLKSAYTASKAKINCIKWGTYGQRNVEPPTKKQRRKSNSEVTSINSVVIAIGTNQSEINLFSVLENRVIATLENAHPKGTRDFIFIGNEAWSVGTDSTLIQWDLNTLEKLQTIQAPVDSIRKITSFSSSLLLGSQDAYLYDPSKPKDIKTIPCFDEPIHTIISQPSTTKKSPASLFIAAADSKSTIGVYSVGSLAITGNLNSSNAVTKLAFFTKAKHSIVAAISESGDVEVFDYPFDNWASPEDDLKTKRKKSTRRANAAIQVRRPDKSATIVSVLDATFDTEGVLVLALAEGSTQLGFERISSLNDEGSLALNGTHTIDRAKSSSMVNEHLNGVKDMRHAHIDESRAVIGHGSTEATKAAASEDEGPNMSTSEDEEEDEQENEVNKAQTSTDLVQTNGISDEDADMADVDDNLEDTEETEEPTFGEMIKARGINTVTIPDQNMVSTATGAVSLSSNLTLGTLLTQALNTNDSASLDTCLAQQDLQVIRATIERLDSGLAITLLHRLAERLHSRPGRAGSLLVWVQWTIVAHGGYLSSRPDTVQQLKSLHRVVQQRAKSLQPLLALKGKLDMLDAQVAFRKRLQQSHLASAGPVSRPEDMIYVEGQPDSDTEDEIEEQGLLEDDSDMDEDDDEEESGLQDESEDLDSDDILRGLESDFSEEEMDGEVNHDDVDPVDSDTSDDGISAIGGRQVNGIKH